jgi:hypothetical protein
MAVWLRCDNPEQEDALRIVRGAGSASGGFNSPAVDLKTESPRSAALFNDIATRWNSDPAMSLMPEDIVRTHSSKAFRRAVTFSV